MTRHKVTYLDGTSIDVDVIPADIVEFERRYHSPIDAIAVVLQEHALFMVYAALRRLGKTRRLVFEQWLTTVASVASDDE